MKPICHSCLIQPHKNNCNIKYHTGFDIDQKTLTKDVYVQLVMSVSKKVFKSIESLNWPTFLKNSFV